MHLARECNAVNWSLYGQVRRNFWKYISKTGKSVAPDEIMAKRKEKWGENQGFGGFFFFIKMFSYLAINFWKCTSSHTFLNSQEQICEKNCWDIFHRSSLRNLFFLYSLDFSFSLKVNEYHTINLTRTHLHVYVLKTQSSSYKIPNGCFSSTVTNFQ